MFKYSVLPLSSHSAKAFYPNTIHRLRQHVILGQLWTLPEMHMIILLHEQRKTKVSFLEL